MKFLYKIKKRKLEKGTKRRLDAPRAPVVAKKNRKEVIAAPNLAHDVASTTGVVGLTQAQVDKLNKVELSNYMYLNGKLVPKTANNAANAIHFYQLRKISPLAQYHFFSHMIPFPCSIRASPHFFYYLFFVGFSVCPSRFIDLVFVFLTVLFGLFTHHVFVCLELLTLSVGPHVLSMLCIISRNPFLLSKFTCYYTISDINFLEKKRIQVKPQSKGRIFGG
jgi:hypothetical protein